MITLTLDGIAQVTQHLQRLVAAPFPATGEGLYMVTIMMQEAMEKARLEWERTCADEL